MASARILRLVSATIVGVIAISLCMAVTNGEDGRASEDGAKKEGADKYTFHQRVVHNVRVNVSDVNFTANASEAAEEAVFAITERLHHRMSSLFEKASTPECRALIAEHYGYYVNAIAKELPLPFVDSKFTSQCEGEVEYDFDNLPKGVNLGTIQARTYKPPRNETKYIGPEDIVFCYGILAHDSADATIRLIEAVDEPTTIFVVHVDAKYEETHQALLHYAAQRERMYLLGDERRVRVNWGGFTMVNATLQVLAYADRFDFTHFVHMASTAYPVASNRRIRNKLAEFPADANFMHVILKPTRPKPHVWHYFVECDDQLHRIYRLSPMTKATHGADVYTSSQWFIISKEFAHYLANPVPGTFLYEYLEYIPHVVIADESFFGTVLRNTPFCHKHHNWHFLHLQFDKWENERAVELRDPRKCVMPDPNHCGRSPTTITLDYLDILEISGDLFARKFLDDVDQEVKDAIDMTRANEEEVLTTTTTNVSDTSQITAKPKVELNFEGIGVLFVAKETVNDTVPLCLGLGEEGHLARLVPCFRDWVIETLAPTWETGSVLYEEVLPHNRWQIGPCSLDGKLERADDGIINSTAGQYNPTGPRCMIRIMDGIRRGRCFDGESFDTQPGGTVQVFPCNKKWNQFLSFGNGKDAPRGSLHTTIPLHTRRRMAETGLEQEPHMCIGVSERGDRDEEDWVEERRAEAEKKEAENSDQPLEDSNDGGGKDELENISSSVDEDRELSEGEEDGLPPLSRWKGEQVYVTRCSNVGGVVEWVVVPFIREDPEMESSGNETNATASNGTGQNNTDEEEEEEL